MEGSIRGWNSHEHDCKSLELRSRDDFLCSLKQLESIAWLGSGKEGSQMSFHFASQLTMPFVEPRETHHPQKPIGNKQNAKILEHLNSGRSITAIEALQLYGCFRLAARIHDLKKAGVPIKCEERETESGKRIASYSLA